jgi:hypothetical protein
MKELNLINSCFLFSLSKTAHFFKIPQSKVSLVFILLASLQACSLQSRFQDVVEPRVFPDTNAALIALEEAVSTRSIEKANELFGSDGDYILHSGDSNLDKQRGEKFVSKFNEFHRLDKNEDGTYILVIGKNLWPFPVPLVKTDEGWKFDAVVGKDEILTRVIGSNELSTMEILRTIYLAQRIYSATDWNQDGVFKYADFLISPPGTKDGLYWPKNEGEVESPLAPTMLKAAEENYTIADDGKTQPYNGYYYKLITTPPNKEQSKDLFTKPGSYWLISYPAAWGVSGITTFAVNERGWIYEKDFEVDKEFSDLVSLTIDETWTRIE